MKEFICSGYESRMDGTLSGQTHCVCGKSCVYWSYDGCKKKKYVKVKHDRNKKELYEFLKQKQRKTFEKECLK